MRRYLPISGLLLLLFAAGTPAAARPAPMSDAELLSKSDLVALVRVLSVTGPKRAAGAETFG